MKQLMLDAYNRFCEKEYNNAPLSEIPENGILDIAYTTYGFGDGKEREIQVCFDTKHMVYLHYIDNRLVKQEDPIDEEQFISDMDADFSDMIRIATEIGEDMYGMPVDDLPDTFSTKKILDFLNSVKKDTMSSAMSDETKFEVLRLCNAVHALLQN